MAVRREFTRKVRAAAKQRSGDHCERCKAVLKPGEAEFDHILPCELGGEPTLVNCQVLCRQCHVAKSATDIKRVRKADRQRDKSSGAIRPKGKIPQRPKQERIGKASLLPRNLYMDAANDG